jgi:threonine dehydrogenase-like Zn-dependent dehydrogenase
MMREVVFNTIQKQFLIREVAPPTPAPDEVQVRVELAAPKHGTESHFWSNRVFRGRRWDPELRLFRAAAPATPSDVPDIVVVGNMAVGVVEQVGTAVQGFRPGERVYGYMPVREVHSISAHKLRRLPPDLSPEAAVCIDPAHVAFVALRDGNVRLGDWVAVFGLGAIGLLTVQAAVAAGAERVVAVDPLPARRERALRMGAAVAVDPAAGDLGVAIKEATERRGVDVAIETSGADSAMHEAVRCIMQCGTVVNVGWSTGTGAGLYLGEELHVNRPRIVASQASSYWSNPDRDHPLWNEPRAQTACAALFRRGRLSAEGILDPIVDFEDAPAVLQSVLDNPAGVLKVGIRLPK